MPCNNTIIDPIPRLSDMVVSNPERSLVLVAFCLVGIVIALGLKS
jgi:hypothetical protein